MKPLYVQPSDGLSMALEDCFDLDSVELQSVAYKTEQRIDKTAKPKRFRNRVLGYGSTVEGSKGLFGEGGSRTAERTRRPRRGSTSTMTGSPPASKPPVFRFPWIPLVQRCPRISAFGRLPIGRQAARAHRSPGDLCRAVQGGQRRGGSGGGPGPSKGGGGGGGASL